MEVAAPSIRPESDPRPAVCDPNRRSAFLISAIATSSIFSVALLGIPTLRHWSTPLMFLYGFLLLPDIVLWARRRSSVLDPTVLLSAFLLYFLLVVPIGHIALGFWLPLLPPSGGWQHWVGMLLLLYGPAVLLHSLLVMVTNRTAKHGLSRVDLKVRPRTLAAYTGVAVVLATILSVSVLVRSDPFATSADRLADSSSLVGTMPMLLFSERLPLLLMLLAILVVPIVNRLRESSTGQWVFLTALMTIAVVVVGFRGSRSNVYWLIIWIVTLHHIYIRPLTRKAVLVGFPVFGLLFLLLTVYKFGGLAGLSEVVGSDGNSATVLSEFRVSLESVALWDIGRTDVQAYILSRLGTGSVSPLGGETYLGDLISMVPGLAGVADVPSKVEAGTLALYGSPVLYSGAHSSRIYGLMGEGFMNFGMLFPAFLALGPVLLAHVLRKVWLNAPEDSAYWIVHPFLMLLPAVLYIYDLDNVVVYLVKNGLIPMVLILIGGVWVRRAGPRDDPGFAKPSNSRACGSGAADA